MDRMYSDVGKKIMFLAKICAWIICIAGVLIFFISIPAGGDGPEVYGWISLVFGLLGFIMSWPLYGLGQMIDDIHAMRKASVKKRERIVDELPEL